MERINIVNVSGGVDSTACYLMALEQGKPFRAVFTDTGNEHEYTIDYINELAAKTGGPKAQTIKADFRYKIAVRWDGLQQMLETGDYKRGWTEEGVKRVLENLHVTGIPMLDLCMLKGRFPSTKARFCTVELKLQVIKDQAIAPTIHEAVLNRGGARDVWSWVGIRRDESEARSHAEMMDYESMGNVVYRPLVEWTKQQCFDLLKKHGVEPNPLYKLGCGRVGCMLCINARKNEILEVSKRFPHHIDKIREWEQIVSKCSKREISTFFAANKTPGVCDSRSDIDTVVEWSKTGNGGIQYDLLAMQEPLACSSLYGLCE